MALFLAIGYGQEASRGSNRFSEVPLGPVPDPVTIILTKDKRHAVYAVRKGDKEQVFFDGQASGPEFEGTFMEDSVASSSDGQRMGYAVGKDAIDQECSSCGPLGQWHAVIDGQPGPEYDKINGIVFSPDGKTVAYGATKKKEGEEKGKDRWRMVVNGKEGLHFSDAISNKSPRFTPDGKHLVYEVLKGEKSMVVIDDHEDPAYDKIGQPIPFFSAEGAHMAYSARNYDGPESVILDGKPGPGFDNIPAMSLVFSPDGKHLAYGALEPTAKWRVVLDGKISREYDQVDNIVFSPDGKHLAFKAKQGEKWSLVVDNEPRPGYEELAEGFPVFSPDNGRIAYGFKKNGKWKVCVEVFDKDSDTKGFSGVIGGEYDKGVGLITFSPDGKHLAFGGRNGESRMVVVDGERGPEHDDVDHIVFSPDGRRVAYEAGKFYKLDPTKDDKWFVVVDGQAKPSYDVLMRGSLLFSANGEHVAYAVTKGGRQMAVIDDQEGPECKTICHLLASAENGFESLVIGDHLGRMIWKP